MLDIITVTDSGEWVGYKTGMATIDHIIDWADNSCFVTADTSGNGWIIFHLLPSTIKIVRGLNRPVNGARMENTKVEVCEQGSTNCEVCGLFPATADGTWGEVTCDPPLVGTEVRLTPPLVDALGGTHRYVALCEVEIYGFLSDAPRPVISGSTYIIQKNH